MSHVDRLAVANAAIDQLTVREFIGLVRHRLTGIAPEHAEVSPHLMDLACSLAREGARLSVILGGTDV